MILHFLKLGFSRNLVNFAVRKWKGSSFPDLFSPFEDVRDLVSSPGMFVTRMSNCLAPHAQINTILNCLQHVEFCGVGNQWGGCNSIRAPMMSCLLERGAKNWGDAAAPSQPVQHVISAFNQTQHVINRLHCRLWATYRIHVWSVCFTTDSTCGFYCWVTCDLWTSP